MDVLAPQYVVPNFPALSVTPTANELRDAAVAVRAAITNGGIAEKDFRKSAGDAQYIDVDGTATQFAWVAIYPHKGAHKGNGSPGTSPVAHGKLLARIESDRDVPRLGLKTGINYWVAGLIADVPTFAVMVAELPATAAADTARMLRDAHSDGVEKHEGPVARWASFKRTPGPSFALMEEAWATCDPDGCCCTGARSCGF